MKDILKDYPLDKFRLDRVIEVISIAWWDTKHPQSQISTTRFIMVNPISDQIKSDKNLEDWQKFENWKEGLKPKYVHEHRVKGVMAMTFGDQIKETVKFKEQEKFYNLLFVEGMEVKRWDESIRPLVLHHIARIDELTIEHDEINNSYYWKI